MGQVLDGREIHLVPAALPAHARRYRRPEDSLREVRDARGELALVGRVLDRVSGQRAAVADQVAEQRQLVFAHARQLWPAKVAGHRNRFTLAQPIEALPAADGEEL